MTPVYCELAAIKDQGVYYDNLPLFFLAVFRRPAVFARSPGKFDGQSKFFLDKAGIVRHDAQDFSVRIERLALSD